MEELKKRILDFMVGMIKVFMAITTIKYYWANLYIVTFFGVVGIGTFYWSIRNLFSFKKR